MLQERNTRELSARSVLASLLLGMRDGKLPGSALVRAGSVFDFAEGTTRVALSRMVAAGELTTEGGEYRLAGPLLARHGRQEEGRRPRLRRWDGTWRIAIVGSSGTRRDATERALVRRTLAELRLGEWREGVWLRPDNLERTMPPIEDCAWVTRARLADDDQVDDLVARLWNPGQWATEASRLRGAMATTVPEAGIADSFLLAAAVVRHMRDDPLLPPELLPAHWPGDDLRSDYDRYEVAFRAAVGEFYR